MQAVLNEVIVPHVLIMQPCLPWTQIDTAQSLLKLLSEIPIQAFFPQSIYWPRFVYWIEVSDFQLWVKVHKLAIIVILFTNYPWVIKEVLQTICYLLIASLYLACAENIAGKRPGSVAIDQMIN